MLPSFQAGLLFETLFMKKLNVALIGCGFMGRTHSNAYRKVSNFFDLDYQPVLKTICDFQEDKAKAFAAQWGYESVRNRLEEPCSPATTST